MNSVPGRRDTSSHFPLSLENGAFSVPCVFTAKGLWHAHHLSGQGGLGQSPSGEGM